MKPEDSIFCGSASHPSLGEGDVAGQITVGTRSLRFESETGFLDLPLERIVITQDAVETVILGDSEDSDCAITTSDERILNHFVFRQRNNLRAQVQALRQGKENRQALKLTAGFFAVFAVIALLVFISARFAVNIAVRQIPATWETQLTAALLAELKGSMRMERNPKWESELNAIAKPLIKSLPRTPYQFEFLLLDDPVPNAVAFPGGKIFVNRGLLEFAHSKEEVAGVLAHEIAHVTQRHGIRQIISTVGPYYVLRIFISDRNGVLAIISNASQVLISRNFSREHEREADKVAFEYLVKANINPRGLADFLKHFMNEAEPRQESRSHALRTHPPTSERIEYLEQLWNQLPKKSGFTRL